MLKKRCPADTPTRPDRTSWGIKGKDLYLLHVLRKRMEYPELKRAVREQCQAFEASVVVIEDKASGTTPRRCASGNYFVWNCGAARLAQDNNSDRWWCRGIYRPICSGLV